MNKFVKILAIKKVPVVVCVACSSVLVTSVVVVKSNFSKINKVEQTNKTSQKFEDKEQKIIDTKNVKEADVVIDNQDEKSTTTEKEISKEEVKVESTTNNNNVNVENEKEKVVEVSTDTNSKEETVDTKESNDNVVDTVETKEEKTQDNESLNESDSKESESTLDENETKEPEISSSKKEETSKEDTKNNQDESKVEDEQQEESDPSIDKSESQSPSVEITPEETVDSNEETTLPENNTLTGQTSSEDLTCPPEEDEQIKEDEISTPNESTVEENETKEPEINSSEKEEKSKEDTKNNQDESKVEEVQQEESDSNIEESEPQSPSVEITPEETVDSNDEDKLPENNTLTGKTSSEDLTCPPEEDNQSKEDEPSTPSEPTVEEVQPNESDSEVNEPIVEENETKEPEESSSEKQEQSSKEETPSVQDEPTVDEEQQEENDSKTDEPEVKEPEVSTPEVDETETKDNEVNSSSEPEPSVNSTPNVQSVPETQPGVTGPEIFDSEQESQEEEKAPVVSSEPKSNDSVESESEQQESQEQQEQQEQTKEEKSTLSEDEKKMLEEINEALKKSKESNSAYFRRTIGGRYKVNADIKFNKEQNRQLYKAREGDALITGTGISFIEEYIEGKEGTYPSYQDVWMRKNGQGEWEKEHRLKSTFGIYEFNFVGGIKRIEKSKFGFARDNTYNLTIDKDYANEQAKNLFGAKAELCDKDPSKCEIIKKDIVVTVAINKNGYISLVETKWGEDDVTDPDYMMNQQVFIFDYEFMIDRPSGITVDEKKSEQKTESSTVETQQFFEDAVEYESNLFTVNESLLKSSKTEIEDKIYSSDETITVKVEDDEEVQKWLKEHPGYDANIIWWVEFSCDSDKCEGFDNHLGKGKTNTLLEGRRASVKTIDMKAPEAKEGYHFVGWEKGTTTIGNSGVTVQSYKAIYEEDKEQTPEMFDGAFEYESNSFTLNGSLYSSSKSVEEDTIKDEKVTVSVESDSYVQEWLKEHSGRDANIIWWVQFSCDLDKCEGFDNHLGKGKTDKLLEGRRAEISEIEMTAPKAKDGYHFVGWKKGTTTIGESEVTVQSYEAIYEADEKTEEVTPKSENLPFDVPEVFDDVVEYNNNSFTVKEAAPNSSQSSEDQTEDEELIEGKEISVSVDDDEELKEFFKNHPKYPKQSVIWWVQFSCDMTKCEGFDNHLESRKTDTLLEGRRAEISEIKMTAPEAKDGYHFVGWKKSTTTIGTSKVTVRNYEAIYEEDEKTEESSEPSFENPQIFDQAVEYRDNSFTLSSELFDSLESDEEESEGKLIEAEEISVNVKNDSRIQKWLEKNPGHESSIIWWAQFSCDLNECEGFDNHLEKGKTGTLLEGRRAEISEIKMTAPAAKEGYKFVGWKYLGEVAIDKDGKITVQSYKAVYEKDEKTEEVTPKVNDSVVESDSLVLSEDEILTFESQISDVKEENYSDEEEITIDSKDSLGEFLSKHKGYNDYSVIWWSKFKCDLTKCNGFDGQESILLSRRGDSDITITAPEAKNGYHFAGWKRYLIKALDDGYKVYGYEAVYEEDKETEFSTLLLKEKLADVKELNQSTEKKDHECSKPEDGIWTNIVKNENGKLTIKYEGCHHYVSFAQFVCDLNECVGFNGSDKLTESRRGGTELTVDAPEAREGYHFVGWKKYDLTVDGFSWSYYKANYEKDEESSNKLSTGEMLTPKQVVKLSSIKSNEYYSTENKVVAKVSNDKNVQEWLKKHNNAESSIIWWAKFKCDLNMCEGFDGGQESITEGRRAEIHEIEMTAPKAKDGYKFVGWKVSEEKIKNVTIQVFEAVYEAI